LRILQRKMDEFERKSGRKFPFTHKSTKARNKNTEIKQMNEFLSNNYFISPKSSMKSVKSKKSRFSFCDELEGASKAVIERWYAGV
jgi:hypothetical protein